MKSIEEIYCHRGKNKDTMKERTEMFYMHLKRMDFNTVTKQIFDTSDWKTQTSLDIVTRD